MKKNCETNMVVFFAEIIKLANKNKDLNKILVVLEDISLNKQEIIARLVTGHKLSCLLNNYAKVNISKSCPGI